MSETKNQNVLIKDKYLDPKETPEIFMRMRNKTDIGEIKKLVDEIFPEWFVTTMEIYCPDYPHLMSNWRKICEMANTRPSQIMIVEELPAENDTNHTLISAFAECFTRAGFSVRRKREYIPCENCGSAVPTTLMWYLFKQNGFKVPDVWSSKCKGCM